MIPFHDTESNRYSLVPFMTVILIFLCIAVYLMQFIWIQTPEQADVFVMKYGITPRLILLSLSGGVISNVTSMFLHGSLWHLGSNMLSLWVFGRRVEDACGPWRFLAFYLLAGTGANMLYTVVEHDSLVPGIGASGAIFGVMGAYLLLYPSGRILTWVGWFRLRLRAIIVVVYFVAVQIGPALKILLDNEPTGINHWAHLGGFFSSILILLFLRPAAFARYSSDTLV